MPIFRKKPVVITAEQPVTGVHYGDSGQAYVTTIHAQRVYLAPGDWVLEEPVAVGLYYTCKADIFAATYEPCHDG